MTNPGPAIGSYDFVLSGANIIHCVFTLRVPLAKSLFLLRKIKLMKGKALRKHSLHEKTTASVLLKLLISSNEWCHTTDDP